MREQWIRCTELPMTVFETAGSLFRTNSVDQRTTQSSSVQGLSRSANKAGSFNKSIAKIHTGAIDHLKSLGFTNRAIEDSMRVGGHNLPDGPNQIYKKYKDHIDTQIKSLTEEDS